MTKDKRGREIVIPLIELEQDGGMRVVIFNKISFHSSVGRASALLGKLLDKNL